MYGRMRGLGIVLALMGIVFMAGGAFVFAKTYEGYQSLNALSAAQQDALAHGITVVSKGFTIYPDGSVTLTGTKTAPTLLMQHVALLSRLTHVSTTLTVEPLPYD